MTLYFTVMIKNESNRNGLEKSAKEEFRIMLPNPEIGVPYIYAYVEFNKAIKKLEDLKQYQLAIPTTFPDQCQNTKTRKPENRKTKPT